MKKIILFFSFLILYSNNIFCNDLRDVSFLQVIDSIKEGRLFEAKVWMKNKKVKMEYLASGNLITTIIDKDYMYNYSCTQKTGTKILVKDKTNYEQLSAEVIQSKENLTEFLELVEAQKKGEEVIDNKNCEIYQYFDIKNNALNNVWIWKNVFFPVKSTIEAGGDVITIFYNNIQFKKIKESFFLISKDVKIQNIKVA